CSKIEIHQQCREAGKLDGKVVIITGGASGIGAEAARLFTEHGAKVVIVDLQEELGLSVALSIGKEKVTYYHCDVTNEMEVENAVKFTVGKYGKLDVLLSNAGIMDQPGSVLDMNLEQFDRIMSVNVRGAAAFIKHAARAMVVRGTRGSIICMTSCAAEIGGSGAHAYTASKHGLLGLVRSACGDLGKYGIRVNGVAPYAVATSMNSSDEETARTVEEYFAAAGILKGVVLKVGHVAQAALFLASDDSAYVSGHNLVVDGVSLRTRLDGKVVIITGGASGIGAESARLFTDHGAKVVIVDIQEELGQNVAVSIGKDKANTPGSILDLNLEHFDRVMGVNVRGAAAFIKHAARAMVGSGTRGSIVCTTSVTAEIGVNGVAPFAVATSMTSRDEETAKQVEGYCEAVGILKGVALKPNHVAKAALFLASDDSIYISGHNLVLDGGFSVSWLQSLRPCGSYCAEKEAALTLKIRRTIASYSLDQGQRALVRLGYGRAAGEGYILAGFSSLGPSLFSPWLLYWLGTSWNGTQASSWTFMLVMIYFAMGIVASLYGCLENYKEPTSGVCDDAVGNKVGDGEFRERLGVYGCFMETIFQTSAGAVVLTDVVFWLVIVPFLSNTHLGLNTLMICMHTANAGFLILDTLLNSLPFPWFRMGYFVIWSCLYIVFQWIIHACGLLTWWPYPFLELDRPWAPLWYLGMAVVHIPCYGVYAAITTLTTVVTIEMASHERPSTTGRVRALLPQTLDLAGAIHLVELEHGELHLLVLVLDLLRLSVET
ncbi:LOW QUALITY PROTEIN: hypothetical protein HID58_052517, partial [Brassica napus]